MTCGGGRNEQPRVALRKESVDRNIYVSHELPFDRVALRKESVDRNCIHHHLQRQLFESLSARRAWIEMASDISIL